MSCDVTRPYPVPYVTGMVPGAGERLPHPGGLTLTRYAVQRAELHAGARVLDLGCGGGESQRFLRSLGLRAVGVDRNAVKARIQRNDEPDCDVVCAAADALPFRDRWFDGVLAECSLSVMEHREQVLNECARILAPDGRLIVCDLYARNPAAISVVRSLGRSCVAGMVVRAELEAQLTERGFTIDVWEDHSQALREYVARLLMDGGSLEALWNCTEQDASAHQIQRAMKDARAGYFLLIATSRAAKGNIA